MATKKLKALSNSEVRKRLPELHGWSVVSRRAALRVQVRDLPEGAGQFVASVGAMAEAANHHPDIDIRYCVVKLALSTHDAGGISEKDFALAGAIDRKSAPQSTV